MNEYRRLIAGAVAAVEVVSPTCFEWFGVPFGGLAPETETQMDAGSARAYLVHNLQAKLYSDFYCAGQVRPQVEYLAAEPPLGESPFVQSLSRANLGTAAREPGWAVVRTDGPDIVVARGGLSLWVSPAELYAPDGSAFSPGQPVGLVMPKELLRISPGFYMALGNAEFPVDGSMPVVRFYWNLRSEGAPALIRLLTERMNGAGLGFRLKVLNDPAAYQRCDAGVLYILKCQYDRVAPLVSAVHQLVAEVLKPSTPALTRSLAPGLGLAEDPGEPFVSFGMSRCQLLAEAIARAAEAGARSLESKLRLVAERFAEEGIDIDVPYLCAGSADSYSFAVT